MVETGGVGAILERIHLRTDSRKGQISPSVRGLIAPDYYRNHEHNRSERLVLNRRCTFLTRHEVFGKGEGKILLHFFQVQIADDIQKNYD